MSEASFGWLFSSGYFPASPVTSQIAVLQYVSGYFEMAGESLVLTS